jgi:hypothetical protein
MNVFRIRWRPLAALVVALLFGFALGCGSPAGTGNAPTNKATEGSAKSKVPPPDPG